MKKGVPRADPLAARCPIREEPRDPPAGAPGGSGAARQVGGRNKETKDAASRIIQGNLRALPSIPEPLHVALENGAIRAFVPIANKPQFGNIPEEVVEKLGIVFYGDVERAVMKAIEV